MSDRLDTLIRRWTRLGAGFSAEPESETPDLERLLLETSRHASQMARLFIVGAAWLRVYGSLVAKHRLERLIEDELEPEYQPVLGMLLDIAQQGTHPARFASVIRSLKRAEPARPLFESERTSEAMAARAERRASAISRRWGLWCAPFDSKEGALRPAAWVMGRNAGFVTRVDLRGDLRASVLAALRFDAGAGESEVSLARAAGGSRAQVRSALEALALTGRVRREKGRGRRLGIVLADAA